MKYRTGINETDWFPVKMVKLQKQWLRKEIYNIFVFLNFPQLVVFFDLLVYLQFYLI